MTAAGSALSFFFGRGLRALSRQVRFSRRVFHSFVVVVFVDAVAAAYIDESGRPVRTVRGVGRRRHTSETDNRTDDAVGDASSTTVLVAVSDSAAQQCVQKCNKCILCFSSQKEIDF